MRSRLLSIALLLLLATPGLAQPWVADELWYGGADYDVLYDLCLTNDGGFLFVGQQTSATNGFQDLYLEKVHPNGSTEWSLTDNVTRMDELYSVLQAFGEGYVAAGATSNQGDAQWDGYVVKISATGAVVWDTQLGEAGDDRFVALTRDDSGYVVAGHSRSEIWEQADFNLTRLEADGTVDWTLTYGGERDDVATALARASNGNLLIAGYTHSFDAVDSDLLLILVDENGEQLNQHREVRPLLQTCVDLVAVESGYVAAGTLYLDAESEQPTPYLMHINDQGVPDWTVTYEEQLPADVLAFDRTPDGEYLLAGQTWFGGHAFVWRVDANGSLLQTWESDHDGLDRIEAVSGRDDNGVLFAGSSSSSTAEVFDFYRGSLSSVYVAWPKRRPNNPLRYDLWPNPFNDRFLVTAELPTAGELHIRMTDLLGRHVAVVTEGRYLPGTHRFQLVADHLATGMYFIESRFDGHPTHVMKAMLVK